MYSELTASPLNSSHQIGIEDRGYNSYYILNQLVMTVHKYTGYQFYEFYGVCKLYRVEGIYMHIYDNVHITFNYIYFN